MFLATFGGSHGCCDHLLLTSGSTMPNGIIRLGGEGDFIELRCVEYGTPPGMADGDLRLEISASADDFNGKYDVWIAQAEWSAFIASLVQFELKRDGKASLFSMSPDDFELHFQCVGHVGGQVVAHGHLSRYHFGHPSPTLVRSRVQYCADVDPSMLWGIVNAFIKMGRRDL